jgi:Tol biopolymer transport system component
MSSDGRYVVFQSSATNLVAGATNGLGNIFVRDMVAGTTVLASIWTNGNQLWGCTSPVITPDGRYVAFIYTFSGTPYLCVRDLVMQSTVLASPGLTDAYYYLPSPTYAYTAITRPAITPDGRYVVFGSPCTGLVPAVTNSIGEVYVRDLVANQTIWASTNASALAQAILGGPSL